MNVNKYKICKNINFHKIVFKNGSNAIFSKIIIFWELCIEHFLCGIKNSTNFILCILHI